MSLPDDVRAECARIAAGARSVRIDLDALAALDPGPPPELDAERHYVEGEPEDVATYMLALDAINFGSGWFPTLRKRRGPDGTAVSGYFTVAWGLAEAVGDRLALGRHVGEVAARHHVGALAVGRGAEACGRPQRAQPVLLARRVDEASERAPDVRLGGRGGRHPREAAPGSLRSGYRRRSAERQGRARHDEGDRPAQSRSHDVATDSHSRAALVAIR